MTATLPHEPGPASVAPERPQVSVGMPVYNGEATLRPALESLLEQTYADLEIIVSDNASSDATETICREYAARDPRIRYFRQPANVGAARNFKAVLDRAGAPFFMWAACDDTRSSNFVEVNLAFLKSHPDYVASCSPVRFEGGNFDPVRMGDGALEGDAAERIVGVFAHPIHANGRFYSLMRREAVAGCPALGRHFLGSDWAVVAHLAARGKLHRCDSGWTVLGTSGISSSANVFRAHRNGWLDFCLPFGALAQITWRIAGGVQLKTRARLAIALLKLNLIGLYGQFLAARKRP